MKGANLAVYVDEQLRLAVHRAVAIETARGWKIAKKVASHRIDLVIALAMAALGAVKSKQSVGEFYVGAVNLAASPQRRSLNGADPEDEAGGYAREQFAAEQQARRRELWDDMAGPLVDAGGGYGSRSRRWQDGF